MRLGQWYILASFVVAIDGDCQVVVLLLVDICFMLFQVFAEVYRLCLPVLNSSRPAPVLKTIFHQCVISYTCS